MIPSNRSDRVTRADPLGGHQVNDVGTQGRALIPSVGTTPAPRGAR